MPKPRHPEAKPRPAPPRPHLPWGGALVLALAVALVLACPPPAAAETAPPAAPLHECFREPGQSSGADAAFAWCVTRLPNSDPGVVLYHLHGRDLDEHIWNDPTFYTELVKTQWSQAGLTPPTIVTVSFGREWVLAPRGQAKQTGLRERFLTRALPRIEQGLGGAPRTRLLLGESMGGFNAIQLLDSGLFAKAAILCPIVYDLDYPFTLAKAWGLVRQTGMEYKIALGFWWMMGDYVRAAPDWQAISPLAIAAGLEAARAPRVYVSCGSRDQYGNFPGTLRFVEILRQRGVSVQWRPLYTRHCGVDVASLAEFLAVAPAASPARP